MPVKVRSPAVSEAQPRNSDYRPDIDGLRAIAVLSIVVFHAFRSLAGGGFVGVDIFFVISGFLISKHIWEELDAGTFSIKTFYARRIRRIFPALSVVLLACVVMGWVILTPREYEQLGTHIVAGAAFLANIIFWKEAGYFDSAADTKPLLHLWSLGVEEQFYIVWPLCLVLIRRYTRHLGWALLGIVGVSLAYSMMLVRHDAVADFYSPLTRFWELALGAGLGYIALHKPAISLVGRSFISWVGLSLILSAVLLLHPGFAFPGAWALVPTVGTACMIYAGEDAWLNRKVLSLRLLVWVGLISYPLYLWHWPLLSFARIMESQTPAIEVRFWLVAASVALAWLTYKLLERPLRSRPLSRNTVVILCLTMFLLAAAGIIVAKSDGFKSRQFSMLNGDSSTIVLGSDRGNLQHECGLAETQKSIFQYCLSSGEPRYALLGDSKGEALFYGLVRESKPDKQWLMIGSVYPPEPDAVHNDRRQLKNRLALRTIVHNPSIKAVVLAVALRDIVPLINTSGFIAENVALLPEKIATFSLVHPAVGTGGETRGVRHGSPDFPRSHKLHHRWRNLKHVPESILAPQGEPALHDTLHRSPRRNTRL